MWPLLQRPLTGFGVLLAQVLRSAHREDLPSLENQDPSNVFGTPDLPILRIVILGDSSVTAPGVQPLNAAWPRRLGRYFGERYHVTMESVAVGGSKARDVLRNQLDPALELGADIALLSFGANDALRGTPIAQFEAEYELIVEALTSATPLVGICGVGDLGTVGRLPTLARAIGRVRGRSINEAIRRVRARHPGVVKSRTWGTAWSAFEDDPERVFAPDEFHASADGHALFAACMIPVVEALLDSPPGRALIASRGNHGSTT